MTRARFLSNRAIASLAVGLFACLSLTIAVSSRIHFSASTDNSPTVTLDAQPASVDTAPGNIFSTTLTLMADQAVVWEEVSFSVAYDPKTLLISNMALAPGWRLKSSQVLEDTQFITLLNDSDDTRERVQVGTISWQALKEGNQTISFSEGTASLPILGQSDSLSVSVPKKEIPVTIAEQYRKQAGNAQTPTSTSPEVSKQLLVSPGAALFAFSSELPSNVTINYGETVSLGAQISSSIARRDQLLRIDNLKPNTTYYYQVSLFEKEHDSQIRGQIKRFTTPDSGGGQVVFWQTLISPTRPTNFTTIYLLGLDKDGKAVTGLVPKLSVSRAGTARELKDLRENNGYYQGAITFNETWREADIEISNGGLALNRLHLEPASTQSAEPSTVESTQTLKISHLQTILTGGIICLIGLLLLFRYLARMK